jgi:transcriptional regulator with GAF, ATPase, and Fis domain
MMERAALLAAGSLIDSLTLPTEHKKIGVNDDELRIKTMEENERDHIITVLKKCDWRVYGPGGAAETLAMNVSTLNSRIKKLGIEKRGSSK